MKHNPFFPDTVIEQILWMNTFGENIDTFASKYGLTAGQVAALKADVAYLGFWFGVHKIMEPFSQSATAFEKEIAHGLKPGHLPSAEPTLPTLGTPPAAVAPGVIPRVMAVANSIKANIAYTAADGEVLGLEGAAVTFNPSEGKPNLKVKLTDGGHVLLHAKKGHYEGYAIYKNTGSGYVKIDSTSHADYLDLAALPALGVSAIWKYKTIYLFDSAQAGDFSDEVSITVTGGV